MSSELRVIGAEELRARLPMAAAVDALEDAFRTLDPTGGPLRTHVETPDGSLLLMPAFGEAGVGVKLVTLTPANPARGSPLHPRELRPVRCRDAGAGGRSRRLGAHRAPDGRGLRPRDPLPEQAGRGASRRLRRGRAGEVAPRGDVRRPPGDRPRGRVRSPWSGRGSRGGGPRPRSHVPRRGPRGGARRRISSAPARRRRNRCSTDRGCRRGST